MPTGRKDGMPFTTKSKDETISGALGISEDKLTEIATEIKDLMLKGGSVSDDLVALMGKFEDKEVLFACYEYGAIISHMSSMLEARSTSGLGKLLNELKEIMKD